MTTAFELGPDVFVKLHDYQALAAELERVREFQMEGAGDGPAE